MRDYPEYASEILQYRPEGYGYVPTQRLCVVQAPAAFRLPGGRETALVQRWDGPCVGDDPVWVYVPYVTLLGL